MAVYTTKLQLVNHVLKTLKQDLDLREEDLTPHSQSEMGAFIAVELQKILEKALYVRPWRFATVISPCTFLDEIWERCRSVFEVTDDIDNFLYLGSIFFEKEYEKKHTHYGLKPPLLAIIVKNKKFGTNWDVSDAINKNNVVFANVITVPAIETWTAYFTEHIEKELEIPLFEKLTGLADTNRYKLTKQKSMEALEMARQQDLKENQTDAIWRIRGW